MKADESMIESQPVTVAEAVNLMKSPGSTVTAQITITRKSGEVEHHTLVMTPVEQES